MKDAILFGLSATLSIICMTYSKAELLSDSNTGIEGTILVSPSHPGPIREGVSSTAPVPGMEFSVAKEGGEVAAFKTDEQGHFRVNVPPGKYTVASKARKMRIGRFGPFDVEVSAGKLTKVEWTCDSGMR